MFSYRTFFLFFLLFYLHFTHSIRAATTASNAASNSANTIAPPAIYGCPMRNDLIIASIAVSAASAEPKTFCIAAIVACALTSLSTPITIARWESTSPIVPSAKNTSFRLAPHRTKCPADTPFIGIAFVNLPLTIPGARSARKQPKPRNA